MAGYERQEKDCSEGGQCWYLKAEDLPKSNGVST